ncbi:MAG: type II toxin-antitoxin system VapC family toxin [Proteobacteria bacterium]|nr:type II toxin-antitoxin system VapC family toxin [Pseudomonadota bacterium]
MIVVDTNIIAYLYLPTQQTESIERLLSADPNWVAPPLWRSEMRNILATYLRSEILGFETACNIQHQAELLMGDNEYKIDSITVLTLAKKSGCSAYDCEFIALAMSLDTVLITADKKLLASFPTAAMCAADYPGSLDIPNLPSS